MTRTVTVAVTERHIDPKHADGRRTGTDMTHRRVGGRTDRQTGSTTQISVAGRQTGSETDRRTDEAMSEPWVDQ